MSEYDYTGNKTKNYFTAYLQKCIRWKRYSYLKEKNNINSIEKPLGKMQVEYKETLDEILERCHKYTILLNEQRGIYPNWIELSNQKLSDSLMLLCEEERWLIYQHVFEEKSFKEISTLNGMSEENIKRIYYYAIRKIRKWMKSEG